MVAVVEHQQRSRRRRGHVVLAAELAERIVLHRQVAGGAGRWRRAVGAHRQRAADLPHHGAGGALDAQHLRAAAQPRHDVATFQLVQRVEVCVVVREAMDRAVGDLDVVPGVPAPHLAPVRGRLLDDRVVGGLRGRARAGGAVLLIAVEAAQVALRRVVGHLQVVAVVGAQEVVAAGVLGQQRGGQGGGVDTVERGVQDDGAFDPLGVAFGEREAAVGVAPEVARAHVGPHHPARHAVVVHNGQERDVGSAYAGGHQQQAAAHGSRPRLDGDVREVRRNAVQVVGGGAPRVADLDCKVVAAVDRDRLRHGAGRGSTAVQHRQAGIAVPRLRVDVQRRPVVAPHRVVAHAGIESRIPACRTAHLQRLQRPAYRNCFRAPDREQRSQGDAECREDPDQASSYVYMGPSPSFSSTVNT